MTAIRNLVERLPNDFGGQSTDRKGILTPTELALKMQQIEAERRHD